MAETNLYSDVAQEKDDLLLHDEEGGGIKHFWKVLRAKIAELSVVQLIFIGVLIIFMMAGNALQIIGLNFWLQEFPYQGQSAAFTILAMSGAVFSLFFIISFFGYSIVNRPNLNFAKDPKGWLLLVGIGFTDTFNSFMNIYAASYTPEVLQALFQALMPLYTLVMTKYILHDPRSYINRWVLSSFSLTVVGIFMAAIPDFISPHDDEDESQTDKVCWSLIFFASVPLTALMNVWQTKYMEDYTYTAEEQEIVDAGLNSGVDGSVNNNRDGAINNTGSYGTNADERAGLLSARSNGSSTCLQPVGDVSSSGLSTNNANGPASSGANGEKAPMSYADLLKYKGADTPVKLLMLFAGCTIQALMSFSLLPADAMPWYGGAESISDAAMHFSENTRAIFNDWRCTVYCIVYSSGFVFTYIGGAYLNQYSPTLCCMIGQLSSPMTALTLIIVPAWNVVEGQGAWYWSVIAIIMLSVGTLLYSAWEEMSSQEEARKAKIAERERQKAENEAKQFPVVV